MLNVRWYLVANSHLIKQGLGSIQLNEGIEILKFVEEGINKELEENITFFLNNKKSKMPKFNFEGKFLFGALYDRYLQKKNYQSAKVYGDKLINWINHFEDYEDFIVEIMNLNELYFAKLKEYEKLNKIYEKTYNFFEKKENKLDPKKTFNYESYISPLVSK